MAQHRTYTIELKQQVVQEHLSQGTSLNQLARRHDISRELLRIWMRKHEADELASNCPGKTDRQAAEAEIARLERKVGQLTMELDLLEKGLTWAQRPRSALSSVVSGPKPAASGPGAGS
jgi:transposase-like protein